MINLLYTFWFGQILLLSPSFRESLVAVLDAYGVHVPLQKQSGLV